MKILDSLLVKMLAACLLTAQAGFVGYYRIFSVFADYDDEGYVMISARDFIRGHVLYQEIYTQYGPAFYVWKWLVHTITQAPVSHDATRLTSLFTWLAATLLCSLFVYRATRSLALAAITHLFVFRALAFITNEPGHPQEFCALLLSAAMVVATLPAGATRGRLMTASLGVILALLALTKINLGAFLLLSLAVTLLLFSDRRWLRIVGFAAGAGAALFVPPFLMRAHLSSPWWLYGLVVTLSLLSATVIAFASRKETAFDFGHYAAAVVGFGATALLLALLCMAQGLSGYGLLHGLIVQNLTLPSVFFTIAPLAEKAHLVACAGFSLALLYAWQRRRIESRGRLREHLIPAAKVLFGLVVFYLNVANVSGLYSLNYAAPFLWLVLIPAAAGERLTFPRALVCLTGLTEALQVYPIAGSQMSNGSFLMLPAAAVCLGDGLTALRRGLPAGLRIRWAPAAATLLTVVLVFALHARQSNRFERRYAAYAPLNLPGAHRLRLPAKIAATYQSIVSEIKASCDSFVSIPGVNSLYFWTQTEAPTSFNTTTWMTLFSEEQQRAMLEKLAAHDRPCVVYHAKLAEWWVLGRDMSKLMNYVRRDYQEVRRVGDFELMVKRDGAAGKQD